MSVRTHAHTPKSGKPPQEFSETLADYNLL
jgi:hypothetical protein